MSFTSSVIAEHIKKLKSLMLRRPPMKSKKSVTCPNGHDLSPISWGCANIRCQYTAAKTLPKHEHKFVIPVESITYKPPDTFADAPLVNKVTKLMCECGEKKNRE